MMSPDRAMGSSSRSAFSTLDEAELSESLVYLTCPICEEARHCLPPNGSSAAGCQRLGRGRTIADETAHARADVAAGLRYPSPSLSAARCMQVLGKDPVFTPCHHTFCGDCIRERLRNDEETCAECRKPLKVCAAPRQGRSLLVQVRPPARRRCGGLRRLTIPFPRTRGEACHPARAAVG
jgi:hypothetical protein